jgi:hypothetical protein
VKGQNDLASIRHQSHLQKRKLLALLKKKWNIIVCTYEPQWQRRENATSDEGPGEGKAAFLTSFLEPLFSL